MVRILTKQGLCCRIDWCSSEWKTWFDSLPQSSSPQKITTTVDSKQYSRSSGETEAAKLPAKTTGAAKSGLRPRDKDTGSDSESEVDEEDLRLLKNARVRLEGSKLTSTPHSAQEISDPFTRPPRLPLPIEKDVGTPGSPIIALPGLDIDTPVLDVDQLDNNTSPRRWSTLSNTTIDEEDVEELRINKTEATVPATFEWHQKGEEVYMTGTILQWNRKKRLHPV
jgi:hypothetical protein